MDSLVDFNALNDLPPIPKVLSRRDFSHPRKNSHRPAILSDGLPKAIDDDMKTLALLEKEGRAWVESHGTTGLLPSQLFAAEGGDPSQFTDEDFNHDMLSVSSQSENEEGQKSRRQSFKTNFNMINDLFKSQGPLLVPGPPLRTSTIRQNKDSAPPPAVKPKSKVKRSKPVTRSLAGKPVKLVPRKGNQAQESFSSLPSDSVSTVDSNSKQSGRDKATTRIDDVEEEYMERSPTIPQNNQSNQTPNPQNFSYNKETPLRNNFCEDPNSYPSNQNTFHESPQTGNYPGGNCATNPYFQNDMKLSFRDQYIINRVSSLVQFRQEQFLNRIMDVYERKLDSFLREDS